PFAAAVAQSPVAAQPVAPAPAAAGPPWQVDWGRHYCSLIRLPAPDRPFAAAFLSVPGSDSTELLLIQMGAARLPQGVTALLLLPQGRRFDVGVSLQLRGTRATLAISGLPYELRGALAAATELQLLAGSEVRLHIPLDQAPAAVAAHRR